MRDSREDWHAGGCSASIHHRYADGGRSMKPLNRRNKARLRKAGIKVLDDEGRVRCTKCDYEWTLSITVSERLIKNYDVCPNCALSGGGSPKDSAHFIGKDKSSVTNERGSPTLIVTPQSKDNKSKRGELKLWSIDDLSKSPSNVRTDYPPEKMDILRASVAQVGLLTPPSCTSDGEVYAGWTRVQACKEEGLTEIVCFTSEDINPIEQLIASLSENYARADLYHEEVRSALKKLRDDGMNGPEIARRTGMDERTVYTLLSFYRLPQSVQDDVERQSEEGNKIPMYTLSKITEIIESTEAEQQEEVGDKMVQIALTKGPSGRRVTKERIDEIAKKVKLGRARPNQLDKILKEAQRRDYMTITFSIPDDIYQPYSKYAKGKKLTINEAIEETMRGALPDIKKWVANNK